MFTSTDIWSAASDAARVETVYMARQPILNISGNLAGYEIVFRSSDGKLCAEVDNLAATTNLLCDAFSGMGLERALCGVVGFIKVDSRFLCSDLVEKLAPRRVVLEISRSVHSGPAIIDRISSLRQQRYRFALDDYAGDVQAAAPFLDSVDIVRMDLTRLSGEAIRAVIASLTRPNLRFLAESVETPEQFDEAKSLGFTLFQGFHFARPNPGRGQGPRSPNQGQLLHLVSLLQNPQSDREIIAELKRHPIVSVRMLRIASSSVSGTSQPITSIKDAFRVLGHRQVLRLINVLLFVGQESGALARNPLFQLACSRGKLLEDVVATNPEATIEEQDGAFLAGMLSLVDGLLAQPMHVILEELHLSYELNAALSLREGTLGRLLVLIEALEMGDDEVVRDVVDEFPFLCEQNLMSMQMDAFAWTGSISTS